MHSGAPCATSHPPRPALGSLKSAHPISLRRFLATKGGGGSGNALHHLHGHVSTGLTSRPLTATPLPPRPAAGPLKRASGQLTQIPCVGEGGMGVSVRRRFAMRRRLRRRRQGAGAASSSGGGPAWYLAPIWLPVMWNSGPDTASGKPMILRPAAANHNSFLSKATQRTHGL